MLQRMYARWAEAHGYKLEWIEESPGEEAGIKSVTIRVVGPNAYGWLKSESGVHRLVRISPFDSQARRHTSFASVWVYPVVDETIEVEIQEKDLRIDTYRASGAGGQHVNKTDSAIRLTHLPTGIVVACQTDRSQHRNRAMAYAMLRARLYELELQKRREAAEAEAANKSDIGWGHQIRSYVLQPYQMVKDLRTGVEKGNAQGVLDGDLDDFLEAALAQGVDRRGARRRQLTPSIGLVSPLGAHCTERSREMASDDVKTEVRRTWESAAPGWAKWEAVFAEGLAEATDTMLDMAGVDAGMHVLDLACGAGSQSLRTAERVGPQGRVVASDLSPTMLAHVREAAARRGLGHIETWNARRRISRRAPVLSMRPSAVLA